MLLLISNLKYKTNLIVGTNNTFSWSSSKNDSVIASVFSRDENFLNRFSSKFIFETAYKIKKILNIFKKNNLLSLIWKKIKIKQYNRKKR